MTPRPSPLSAVLTLVGAALVAWSLLADVDAARPVWGLVLGMVALVAWVLRTAAAMLGLRRTALALALAAIVTGAFAAPVTSANSVVAAAVCVLVVIADESLSLGFCIAVAVGAEALIAAGAVVAQADGHPIAVLPLLGMLAGIAAGALAGYSRRLVRRSSRQAALLAEHEIAMREEASRVAIARDLHDVLAHTLGGLVIQLDAAEALLDAGDVDAARGRVTGARALAGDGLGEARRAVAALRSPAPTAERDVAPAELDATLADLVAAHRALGGEADLTVDGIAAPLSTAQATAIERALQEALSNARRHAPGRPVEASLHWGDGLVRLTVANQAAGAGVSPGGGYGLVGMRERFASLPYGGTVTTDAAPDRFTVVAEARTR
jgi:signal transduction histidine kinase